MAPAKDPKQASKVVASGGRRGGRRGGGGGGRENFRFFSFFIVFCRNFGPEPLPERPGNPSGHFELVSASPVQIQTMRQNEKAQTMEKTRTCKTTK